MATSRFCAFNKTRGIILSLDVAVIDAAMDPLRVLRVLMEGLDSETTTGLWLTHFRAVPVARAVSPFDLIYLDKDHAVVHAVALTVDSAFAPFDGTPASALVLPPSVISASRTEDGDQLVIVAAPEAARVPSTLYPPVEPLPVAAAPPLPVTHASAAADASFARYLSGQAHVVPPLEPPAPQPAPSTPTSPEASPIAPQIAADASVEQPAASEPGARSAPVRPTEYYHATRPTLRTRVLRWLQRQPEAPEPPHRALDRRRAYRLNRPGLVAYFFTGGAPRPHRIENISVTGFLMQTDDLWMPGTVIRMTLQKIGTRGDRPGDTITVHSRMVRHVIGGGAFEFVLSGFLDY